MDFPITIFEGEKSIIINNEIDFQQFAKKYTFIHAAGGIVQNTQHQFLMIYRLGYWDFPKGKVEIGESFEETALREVQEETGLSDLILQNPLHSTFHTYLLKGKPILKETHWYTMRSESKSLTPQFEEDITKAEWIDKKDVSRLMERSYPSLCNLWNKIQFIINQ